MAQDIHPRNLGIYLGKLSPGQYNAITDVPGVAIGHKTLIKGSSIRTGATAIIPHELNLFNLKTPAAVYVGNGYGKLVGTSQIEELGNLETPILLTNTLSVAKGMEALITYTIDNNQDQKVRSVNGVVGETNDGYLNDITRRAVTEEHFLEAINVATTGPVAEGSVGAGTGTICFGYKGGIGTSSRQVIIEDETYHVGVLVQSNFGGQLRIGGLPLHQIFETETEDSADGSCMIIVATDAPLLSRNLKRLAKRGILGLARTGGIASNGSGDYVIAFSNYNQNLLKRETTHSFQEIDNSRMSILFQACIEATEEAILNSLFLAESMTGHLDRKVNKIPVQKIINLLKKKNLIFIPERN